MSEHGFDIGERVMSPDGYYGIVRVVGYNAHGSVICERETGRVFESGQRYIDWQERSLKRIPRAIEDTVAEALSNWVCCTDLATGHHPFGTCGPYAAAAAAAIEAAILADREARDA